MNIRRIGAVCKVNHDGYLVNESSWEKIDVRFKEAVTFVVDEIIAAFSKEIHSIYLRGSLPRGLAIEGVSDIDLLIVTHTPLGADELERLYSLEEKLTERFSFVNGVEAGVFPLGEVADRSRFHIIPFMIKTYSVCLYGENLQGTLPDYKPDEKLANAHIVQLKSQIQQAKEDLVDNEDLEDIADCCTWIMKIIVRCGFAFVLIDEQTYTRDLYPAYERFSQYYPHQQKKMRQALVYAINPTSNAGEILSFLDEFGDWMIGEAEVWLNKHNPEKVDHLPL
ncbi:nucleotidyltransferase domain-containing protein [Thalassobacillus hwangdonensis]|uniref:Nucleotidyltransferase domain-containing protein n=1 Tax=Thalassobacillus hwangdonensis TaxID=546108 RepID=A0ABW3L4B8_9BACI